jgi:hypothetical protein
MGETFNYAEAFKTQILTLEERYERINYNFKIGGKQIMVIMGVSL